MPNCALFHFPTMQLQKKSPDAMILKAVMYTLPHAIYQLRIALLFHIQGLSFPPSLPAMDHISGPRVSR
jgi:hypothetical protein